MEFCALVALQLRSQIHILSLDRRASIWDASVLKLPNWMNICSLETVIQLQGNLSLKKGKPAPPTAGPFTTEFELHKMSLKTGSN